MTPQPARPSPSVTPRAIRPPRTFGRHRPWEIDAYLQDYQVRQFRSHSTARGRVAHLTAFFGRAARAAALTTHQIRQYCPAAAGAATGTINRDLGPPPHGHPRRPLGLARYRRVPRPAARESPPPGLLRAPRIPRRPRPPARPVAGHSTSPTIPAGASRRSSASLGRTTKPASSGSRQARSKTGGTSPHLTNRRGPGARRARRDPDSPLVFHRDGIPIRRWRTAWRTACGGRGPTRFLHDCRSPPRAT